MSTGDDGYHHGGKGKGKAKSCGKSFGPYGKGSFGKGYGKGFDYDWWGWDGPYWGISDWQWHYPYYGSFWEAWSLPRH